MAQQASIPHFATQSRTVLSGSEKLPVSQPGVQKPAAPTEQLTVSVVVRRKKPLAAANVSGNQRLSRARFNAEHAADPAAVALVKRFAKEFGLKVKAGTPVRGRRTVKLAGTVAQMQRAFGVLLSHRTIDGQVYRVRDGSIYLPAELQGYVVAVLGLDNRPQATPHFRILGQQGSPPSQFSAAWNNLGTIAYQTGKYDRAEECFREALKQEPRSFEALVNLGGVLVTEQKLDEALDYNRQAVVARPNDALAQSQLGLTYYLIGSLDLATKHLEQAIEIDPLHFSHPQLVLFRIHLRQGNPDAAADVLEDFLTRHPDWPRASNMRSTIVELRSR